MQPRLDDIGRIRGKPGISDYHVRRDGFDRMADGLSVESIGGGGRSIDVTQPIDARAGACRARNLMPLDAQCAHEGRRTAQVALAPSSSGDELL